MSKEFAKLATLGQELAKKVDLTYTSVLDKTYQLGQRAQEPDTKLLLEAIQNELSEVQRWMRSGDLKDATCELSTGCSRMFCPCPSRVGRRGN